MAGGFRVNFVRKMQDIEEKYTNVNGIKIRYIVSGAGSPVLLFHGFGEFLEIWSFNIGLLSKHYRVYAMDLPGHGLSEKPEVKYTVAFATEFATRFVQALGLDHVSLIGHSMGGLLCINAAIKFPEKVDKLVLVDSGGLSEEAPFLYRLSTIPLLGDILLRPTIKPVLKMGMKRAFYNHDVVSEEMIDINYQYLKMPRAKQAMLNIIRSNASLHGPHPEVVVTKKLHLVRSPTLIIHGAQDEVIPVEHAQSACQLIPGAKIKVFSECGHLPQIEKSSEFNQAVLAFLGGL